MKESEFVIRKQEQNTRALVPRPQLRIRHSPAFTGRKFSTSPVHQPLSHIQVGTINAVSRAEGLCSWMQKREGETAQKNPPKSFAHTERCAGPIPPDNRQGQEWQTRPNPCLRVCLISKSKSLEKVIPE